MKQQKLGFVAKSQVPVAPEAEDSSSSTRPRKRPRPAESSPTAVSQPSAVQCPACSARFGSESAVILHLDICLARSAKPKSREGKLPPKQSASSESAAAAAAAPVVIENFITADEEHDILDALEASNTARWRASRWNGSHMNQHWGVQMDHSTRTTKAGTPLPATLTAIVAPKMSALPQLKDWAFNNVSCLQDLQRGASAVPCFTYKSPKYLLLCRLTLSCM